MLRDEMNSAAGEARGVSPYKPEYDEYVRLYTGRGTLKVQLSVARGAYPIRNAEVDVAQIYNGVRYLLYSDVTDISGIADNMALPARDLSASLNFEEGQLPEAEYIVSIYHPDFEPVNECRVVIHDKSSTILPISLIPVTREAG